MTLALRPAGRFYAAFYRWSCSTVRATRCGHSIHHRPSSLPVPPACRSYATTRPLLRDNGAASGAAAHPPAETDQDESAPAGQDTIKTGSADMRAAMREVMRRVPSTVAVITVYATQPGVAGPLPVGSAISSLTTVTLDPPHVSFNIKTPSRTLDAIHKAGGLFRVHFLDNSVTAVKVAQNFTQGNSLEILNERKNMSWLKWAHSARRDNIPPKIVSRCVLASITCQLSQEVTVADHVVAIASVNSFTSREKLAPALLYHEGSFKHYTGSELLPRNGHGNGQKRSGYDEYFNYPLFPGEAEQKDYISQAKEYLKQNPHVLHESDSYKATSILTKDWGMQPGTLGLNLRLLVDQCKVELGLLPNIQPPSGNVPIAHRFYGQLSSTDIATIADRAKTLVEHNPKALDMSETRFLALLDVHNEAYNLLASDILVPLRNDGLVAPFELHSLNSTGDERATMHRLEQVERRLFEFFKTVPYDRACRTTSDTLAKAVGVERYYDQIYLRKIRPRITTEAYPDQFSPPSVDIKGHLSPAEARVAVTRVVDAMTKSAQEYDSTASIQKVELLRQLGIHPMVTGVDVVFLLKKIKYLRSKATAWTHFLHTVNTMLDPLLEAGSFKLEEAQSRARELVETHALKVLNWSPRDRIAAMGFRYFAATVSLNGREVPIPRLTTKLIITALKERLEDNSISSEEKAAITDFLRFGKKANASNIDDNEQPASLESVLQNIKHGVSLTWTTSDAVPATEASKHQRPKK